jgi:hypothetical protein
MERERQERVIVIARTNLGPDFCNKIGTERSNTDCPLSAALRTE